MALTLSQGETGWGADVFEWRRLKKAQKEGGELFFAVFTDIDNTLRQKSGDRAEATADIISLCCSASVPLVAVTGMTVAEVQGRIERGDLPLFSVIAGSVGTELAFLGASDPSGWRYETDGEFVDRLALLNFDRAEIVRRAIQCFDAAGKELERCRLAFQLERQEMEFLRGAPPPERYKVSAHFYAPDRASAQAVSDLVSRFFPRQRIIVCEEINYHGERREGADGKYCLDIVPMTKAGAVSYLCERETVEAGIVCGDSGNDLDMLLNSPPQLVPVLVGGAQGSALEEFQSREMRPGDQGSFFSAFRDGGGLIRECYLGREMGELGPDSILKVLRRLLSERGERSFIPSGKRNAGSGR